MVPFREEREGGEGGGLKNEHREDVVEEGEFGEGGLRMIR